MLHRIRQKIQQILLSRKPLYDIFTIVYEKNLWANPESVSGDGSTLDQTKIVRQAIEKLLVDFSITSIVDAPCGDYHWMKEVDKHMAQYLGIDIVQALVERNTSHYTNDTTHFVAGDLTSMVIPCADLIISRDCLVHLSFEDCKKILSRFKESNSKYLLTTTFSDRHHNEDTRAPWWRPLNLRQSPFNFPEPLVSIHEQSFHNELYPDKYLSLWRLEDITVY